MNWVESMVRAGVIAMVVCGVVACGQSEPPRPRTTTETRPTSRDVNSKPAHLPYQTLRQWSPGGGIGMDILVPEKTTKEQVLELARFIRADYDAEPFIYVFIFDSKTAWQHRDDEAYPQKVYMRHFLATVMRNTKTGFDEIKWQAKGRDH